MKKGYIMRVAAVLVMLMLAIPLSACGAKEEFVFEINEYGEATLAEYHGNGGEVTVPETYNGAKVTAVGDFAFMYKQSVTSVILPESVSSVGKYAFVGSSGIKSIELRAENVVLGEGAFSDCRGLESISLPSCDSIPARAFKNCISLKSAEVGEVLEICDGAFSGCVSLVSFDVPDSTERLGTGSLKAVLHLRRLLSEAA